MIALLKYNAGNITSVQNTLLRLNAEVEITDNPEIIMRADKVIIPGVGEAGSAMRYLREKQLDSIIKQLTQPVLGICLGQQLLCKYSEEGNTDCLGLIPGKVRKFPPTDIVPHMGWNNLLQTKGEIFNNLPQNPDVYFVHSYYCEVNEFTLAQSQYIVPFSAAIGKNNFYGMQFHPEKSSQTGAQILHNFLNLQQ